ncbi:TraX family protein [Lonsdalea quercina]|uniref:TraX family protein n=1 Tax=Lonsdalea quercina TaxID=71657 RepID=UPI0039748CBB
MHIRNIELVKWLALLLMVCDHINKYLLNNSIPLLYNVGRLAMPLFCLMLSYNLSRPNSFQNRVYYRVSMRLIIFGALATPAYILLGNVINHWWPLNILFTLLSLTIVCYLIENGTTNSTIFAFLTLILSGAVVEFCWPAISMGVCFWLYLKKKNPIFLLLTILFCASLDYINQNFYALFSIPLALLAGSVKIKIKRLKWFFYIFYPLHLYLILAVRLYYIKQGYLFF